MVELKVLNNTQKKEANDLYKIYKFIYLCNKCGTIYGADKHDKVALCPRCKTKILRKKKEVKE